MSLKIGLNLSKNYSINFSQPKRAKNLIKYIIIHYTGMKRELDAIDRLRDGSSKVSSHYFIKNNGITLRLVPDLYIAWHAGESNWKNLELLNKHSIGIELHNPGHSHGYKNFSHKQILSLKKLLRFLINKYKINYHNVLGHSDISPSRKKDPGEKFPWKQLSKIKLCHWHNLDEMKLKRYRKNYLNISDEKFFLKNLNKIGYSNIKNMNFTKSNKFIITAFQRRFRQELINGKSDKECLLISKNLMKT